MTAKRISGHIFLLVAALLTIVIVGLLPRVFEAVLGLFSIFRSDSDAYQKGLMIGHLIYWFVHITITIALWRTGFRWIKKRQ